MQNVGRVPEDANKSGSGSARGGNASVDGTSNTTGNTSDTGGTGGEVTGGSATGGITTGGTTGCIDVYGLYGAPCCFGADCIQPGSSCVFEVLATRVDTIYECLAR